MKRTYAEQHISLVPITATSIVSRTSPGGLDLNERIFGISGYMPCISLSCYCMYGAEIITYAYTDAPVPREHN